MNTLDKGLIHISGGRELAGVRFHHIIQNDVQFKIYEMIIFRIFHLVFWDHG